MSEDLKDAPKVMPASTACLFEQIRENPLLSPFVLVGGTALSLHIGHRISEDLDFITLLPKLPRAALKELERELKKDGHDITHQTDPEAHDDFQTSGLELADSQQNWIVDGVVKLTFFSAEPEHERLLAQSQSELKAESGFKIASLEELSRLKATVTASRSKSRDWLDLFILERDHQFGLARWKEAFDQAGLTPMHFEIALNRMCLGRPDIEDEGYSTLLPNPPSVEEIQAKFRTLREDYERLLAEKRASEMAKTTHGEEPNSVSHS